LADIKGSGEIITTVWLQKGGIMAHVEYSTSSYKTPLHHRILANMPVKASWVDSESGETVNVEGMTENVGENSTLVNLETLPPVGSAVRLRIMEENKTIIDVATQVIRVERDPSKPMAALSILENLKKWKSTAMTAAEKWVTRHWQLNYEEEWVN
jgi:hypothetical protein